MQVGTTKEQGLYNKPSAAVHPGGISRRDPTTIQCNSSDWLYLISAVCNIYLFTPGAVNSSETIRLFKEILKPIMACG